ncbi:MAG: DUF1134 domain-containing protein [Rhodospirillales bacterium]|nr:DUF1134 domain-containing protein [Rhodospirillales bacterium]
MKFRLLAFAPLLIFAFTFAPIAGNATENDTYDEESILDATKGFFGATTKGLAELIQKIFKDHGRPNGYIAGEEVSGAIGVGLRYGEGTLHRKNGAKIKVYWQGPSVGFDLGGNASKVFTLVYHLKNNNEIFQRIPGVDGTFYFVGGVGVNYQQSGDLILAPIRTGVGLRAGASIGYLHYNRKHSWIPF